MARISDNSIATLGWLLHAAGLMGIATAVVAYVWFVLVPLNQRQQQCELRVAQLEELLAKSPQVRHVYHDFQAELATLKSSVAETQRRLPAELREHEFIEQLRQAATKTGIEFGDYQIGTATELESYSQAELSIQCSGSYGSICRFLDEIDHLARITEISNLQIESGDNFDSYPVQITFVLYFGGATHDRSRKGEVL